MANNNLSDASNGIGKRTSRQWIIEDLVSTSKDVTSHSQKSIFKMANNNLSDASNGIGKRTSRQWIIEDLVSTSKDVTSHSQKLIFKMANNNLSDASNGIGKRTSTQWIIEDLVSNDPDAESFEDVPSDEAVSNENKSVAVADTTGENFTANGRPKRGRKRKIISQSRADRKRLYNNNETHVNTKGNIVTKKIFDEHFVCPCINQCTNNVPLEYRKRIFNQFQSMESFAGHCALLVSCTVNEGSIRKYNILGHKVCKPGLLLTLQINESRLATAMKKQMQCDTYADGRGKTTGGKNAFPISKRAEVRSHVTSFPKYVSHYTRNQTDSKYLNPNLNLAILYRLYKEKQKNPVSKSYFKRVFYEDFNLKFKKPQKDTCKKCDIYQAKIKSADESTKQMLEEWHDNHLKSAESLKLQMKNDFERSKTDQEVETLSFDLQKTLPLPKLPTNIVYYKRQLNMYNFGIHVGSSGKGIFNVWLENEASRGTQEVGSRLKAYLQTITQPTKNLILWSDSCGGQNRSIKLVLMMKHILQNHPSLETISLRFLQSGYSLLKNDSEFGDFECYLKRNSKICTDFAYMKIMKSCRIVNKFEVNRMSKHDFFSIKKMENIITNRKTDILKNKINWLETHEILLDKFQPMLIKMKKKLDDDFQLLNIEKLGCKDADFTTVELDYLWPQGRPLSKEKVDDLKDILELVPDKYKYFYSFLKDVKTHEFDDVDGFGEFVDFEIEE